MTKKIIAVFCGILLSSTALLPVLHGQNSPAPAEPAPAQPPAISPIPAAPEEGEEDKGLEPAPQTPETPSAPEDEGDGNGGETPPEDISPATPTPAEPAPTPAEPTPNPAPAPAPAAPVMPSPERMRPNMTNRLGGPGRPSGFDRSRMSPQAPGMAPGMRGPGGTTPPAFVPSAQTNRLLSSEALNAARAAQPGATSALPEEVPTTFTTLELDNPGEVMPVGAWQIQNMPLDAFLDVYADLVARTVIRPATLPQAQINFKMKTPLTKRELVQALEGVLMVNQITIIPSGEKFVTASPLADAAGMGSKLNEMDMKEIPESLQFMTQIVQLTNAYPSEVVASIQPFAKIPNGIVSIEESKLVVIRDYAVNVKRMIEILKRVDVVPDDDYSFKVIPIRYGTVEDLNNVVGTLIGSSSSVGSMGSSRTSQTGIGGRTGIGTSSRTGTSSRNNRTSSSSRLTGAQVNMQRLGAGGMMSGPGTFQSRMGNIMGRAGGANQQVSLLMDTAQVIPDERSNSLIVYATKRDMAVITNVIAQLDFLLPMVLIESVIVDVNLGDKFDFGVSAAQIRTNSSNFSGLGGMFNGQGTYSSAVRNAGNLTNMPAGFSYFGKLNDEWEFGVAAAASKNKATVLQRPRILTMHGVPASFFNGQRIPYASSSYYGGYTSSANVSFDYLDVGIQLDVTPYITPNGLVLMDISQTIDEFAQWVEMGNDLKAPQTVNRDATAMIAVQDRESIMLGGFIRQSKSNGNSGVPYLKDIPLLGYLFRSTSTSNDRSELLVFIRPTILDDPEKIREFSESESKTLPGAYMALREYNRDTRNQMLSVLEEEKALDIKEKKELQKFQERMDQLDAKASKTDEKLEQRAERKNLTVVEIPPTDDPAITEIEAKSPAPELKEIVPQEPAQ